MKRLLFIIVIQILFLLPLPAQWVQTNGPATGSGDIKELAVSGPNLLALTSNLMYCSTDNGTTWRQTGPTYGGRHNIGNPAVWGSYYFATEGVWYGDEGDSWLIVSTNNGVVWEEKHGTSGGTIEVFQNARGGISIFTGGSRSYPAVSYDTGKSWDTMSDICFNGMVKIDANIFAGTCHGVFLSTDDGMNWTEMSNGLPENWLNSSYHVEIHNIASSGTTLFASTDSGLFRSSDYGENWIAVNPSPPIENISSLAFSGTTLYAGTASGGYRSTDNGTNWSVIDTGLTRTDISYYGVCESSRFALTDGYLFLTTDCGLTWTPRGPSRYQDVLVLLPFGTNLYAATYGAGVFLSTDNGTTWIAMNSGLTDLFVEALALDSSGNMYAGTHSGGVYRSTNNGTSWTAVNYGLTDSSIQALIVSGTNLFAGTRSGGVFLSTNNGTTWIEMNTGLTNADIWAFAASHGDEGPNIFAGTFGGGVFLSSNSGTSWTAVNTGLTDTYIRALAVLDTNLFAATDGGVFVSTNNGTSWTALDPVLIDPLVERLYVNGTNLFAGTWYGGVFVSTNNGTSWIPVNSGLDISHYVFALAVSDPFLFAGTWDGGVWKLPLSKMIPTSTIEIANGWNIVSLPVSVADGRKESLFPSATSEAFQYEGSYRSKDTLTNGVGYWLKFSEATSLQFYGNHITAETIAVSQGWNLIGSISSSLPVQSITCDSGTITTSSFWGYNNQYFVSDVILPGKGYWVKVNQSGKLILAASSIARSANRIRIVPTSEQPPSSPFEGEENAMNKEMPTYYTLKQNYPNPFNPNTSIFYGIPERSRVVIEIYNVLGQIITTLVDEEQEPGYRSVEWNAANGIGSGMYFYRLTAASVTEPGRMFVQVRKMLMIK